MPDVLPLLLSCCLSLFQGQVLVRTLPRNIFLPQTAKEPSQSFLVGLLKPNFVFLIGGGKDGFVRKLLLLGNDASNLQGLILRMLNPVGHKRPKQILAHVVRSMLMKRVHHVEEVLCYSGVLRLMYEVDPYLHFVPVGHGALFPGLGSGVINQRCLIHGDLGASAGGRVVKKLSQVLLRLCGPARKV